MTTVTATPVTVHATPMPAGLRRPAWGAVFAGAITALGLQMLLTVLGLAIGLTAASDGGYGAGRGDGVSAGAAWWWFLTGLVSLAVGGMIVGRLALIPRSIELAIHGFAMWAITAVLGFVLVWSSAGMAALAGSQFAGSSWANQWSQGMVRNGQSGIAAATSDSTTDIRRERTALADEGGASVTADQAEEAAQTATWWTFAALLLGVGVTVGATWMCAPQALETRRTYET